MSQFVSGADALNALNATNDGGGNSSAEFASFKSGTTYKVRALGTADLIKFYSYGIFKKVNSFVAKNPSVKNARGFAESNFTPWDLASKYYADLKKKAEDAGNQTKVDEYKAEAGKYRAKERFALGFIDLATGEPIIVDLSRKQAQGVAAVIKKYEKKLGKLAFELTKAGSSTSTVVSLSPVIDMDEDLTDAERANFEKVDGKEFDMTLFDGLLFEADEKQQIENLVAAGFDITLIGLSIGGSESAADTANIGDEEDLPF
ncbi:hypothetical protein [Cytobacillus purgationiresistens]|uniref:Uncharacterized protein n=1 Tax=Cytobacillus purgationiresistens TaxID=863449 RepID=A0ABU0AJ30_9BACI|nr:hypothetical protein [Cytobacillus purgationiresistens]MDQ0270772.1 hypothetical protein [Cytobacillus purgationiresistens]